MGIKMDERREGETGRWAAGFTWVLREKEPYIKQYIGYSNEGGSVVRTGLGESTP